MNFMSIAQASESAASTAAKQPSLMENMLPILFIFVVMYFIMIRPQAKKAKEHSSLLKNLKSGDEVVTSGGIIGRVKSVADEFVSVDIGSAQLKILKEHITRLTKPQGENSLKNSGSEKK